MTKKNRALIKQSLDLCDSVSESLFQYITDTYEESAAKEMLAIIMQNTFFAKAPFLRIFIGKEARELDIYFTTQESSLRFLELALLNTKPHAFVLNEKVLYVDVLLSDTLYRVNFNYDKYGTAEEILSLFTFSCEQHYYNRSVFKLNFDIGTFHKVFRTVEFRSEKLDLQYIYLMLATYSKMGLIPHTNSMVRLFSALFDGQVLKYPALRSALYSWENGYGVMKTEKYLNIS